MWCRHAAPCSNQINRSFVHFLSGQVTSVHWFAIWNCLQLYIFGSKKVWSQDKAYIDTPSSFKHSNLWLVSLANPSGQGGALTWSAYRCINNFCVSRNKNYLPWSLVVAGSRKDKSFSLRQRLYFWGLKVADVPHGYSSCAGRGWKKTSYQIPKNLHKNIHRCILTYTWRPKASAE